MYLSSEYDAENPASHNVYRFPIDFQASCADVQYVQEGGYMEISNGDKERYLPEGFSGELADEVRDTERNAWMVREPSKLLCRYSSYPSFLIFCNRIRYRIHRMIDDFAYRCKLSGDAPTPEEGLRFPVYMEALTTGPAWPSSVMKVCH
jgi:hypothetical protein